MKGILSAFLLMSFVTLKAHNIPLNTFDSASAKKEQSIVYKKFSGQYDEIISYSSSGYWQTKKYCFVFGYKNGKWETFYTEINDKKTKKRKLNISKEAIDSLLTFWNNYNFWTLNIDSINCNKKNLPNGGVMVVGVSDGISDNFEFISNNKYHILYSDNPDAFQKNIPISERAAFILCRDKFFGLINRK